MTNIDAALEKVNLTYASLAAISDDLVKQCTTDIDAYVQILNNIESLSNDMLRDAVLKLALKTYSLGEMKEHATFKSEIAETLLKEKQATITMETSGTVDAKKSAALLGSAEEQLVNLIQEQVSDQLNRKLDEAHRIIDAIKNVLISRASEAKLTSDINGGSAE